MKLGQLADICMGDEISVVTLTQEKNNKWLYLALVGNTAFKYNFYLPMSSKGQLL